MTAPTLVDRYIDAAMHTVPERQRADLAAELRASIADQIDARVAAGEQPDTAERGVLTELGDPDALAAGYTDRPLWLIGPRYYLTWWRLLKLLWAIVPAAAAFGLALALALAGASFGAIVGTVASVVFNIVVNLAFWTTLVFFIVERTSRGAARAPETAWTLDQLPEPRDRGAAVSDLVFSLVFLALAAAALLWDHFVGFAYSAETGWVSFLDPDLWPWWIGALLVLIALEAILAISVYAKGRWDIGSATVNLFLNLTVAGGVLWLMSQGQLVNPQFLDVVVIADSAGDVGSIVSTAFAFVLVGIAVWDSVDAFLKAYRAR